MTHRKQEPTFALMISGGLSFEALLPPRLPSKSSWITAFIIIANNTRVASVEVFVPVCVIHAYVGFLPFVYERV